MRRFLAVLAFAMRVAIGVSLAMAVTWYFRQPPVGDTASQVTTGIGVVTIPLAIYARIFRIRL